MKNYFLAVITLIITTSADESADVVADSHPKTLRVISDNTWYLFHKKKEMKAGENWLKKQTPDIVALQELTLSTLRPSSHSQSHGATNTARF